MQEYEGALNFTTDAWTSPNHKAYVAFTVHFEHEGSPMLMLLDVVEVAKSHSSVNLAKAFANVLEEFGIEDKVSSRLHNRILVDLLHVFSSQILSVTCDNASNNNTMVEHLATLVENFPSTANQTRCFTHILNLVAKSILCSFDALKKGAEGNSPHVDDATDVLAALVQELEDTVVEADYGAAYDDTDDDELDCEDDDENGLSDRRDGMSEEEVAALEESLVPVQLMITKVSKFELSLILSNQMPKLRALANTIKNSSTIILPQWLEKLDNLSLKVRMMPWDVSTRWNSTFDMLNFALDYCVAINRITSNQDLNLHKYELEDDEWVVAERQCDTLEACDLS